MPTDYYLNNCPRGPPEYYDGAILPLAVLKEKARFLLLQKNHGISPTRAAPDAGQLPVRVT
ncbi:hypothetical protein [Pandoraea terrae]|uniref:hypothetical protein n=1 Tax=Pandoraea terrae TaxID=1537710 RepID=UPI001783EA26|nr:hypothetical protein [Pandoraea terrae]